MIRDEDVKFGDLFRWHTGGIYMFLAWPPEQVNNYPDGRTWTALIVDPGGSPSTDFLRHLVQQETVGFQCRVRSGDGWVRFG